MGRTTRQLSRKRNKQKQRSGLQPGDMLQERYRIVGTLGVGGFSSVYQARDMRFPAVTKLCAVKEMVIATNDPQLRQLTIKSLSVKPVCWPCSTIPLFPMCLTILQKATAATWFWN
jgi:serine/threonine protein kinase